MLTRATRGLQREPHLTEALTRAFMFADATVTGEIHVVGMRLTAMINRALQGDQYVEGAEPTEHEIAVARVISDVWLAALVAWVTGRSSADEVAEHLDTAVQLILAELAATRAAAHGVRRFQGEGRQGVDQRLAVLLHVGLADRQAVATLAHPGRHLQLAGLARAQVGDG